jgi:hypothetical protein
MSSWDALVAWANAEPSVAGLILSGSRGRGLGGPSSDWDCYLVVASSFEDRDLPATDDAIDLVVMSVDEFRTHAMPGTAFAWNAYAFAHAEIVVDRVDGAIGEIAASKEFIDVEDATVVARDRLDAYINSVLRAAKSRGAGDDDAAALDAVEALGPAIETVFAVESRVRPYNRYLRWELDRHPLRLTGTAALVTAATDAASGDARSSAVLFTLVEAVVRETGLDDVVDGWGEAALDAVRGET